MGREGIERLNRERVDTDRERGNTDRERGNRKIE